MPRDPSHLDHLAGLLELERRAQSERFEAQRAGMSLAQRAAEGLALLDLEAADDAYGLGGRALVDLERPGRAPIDGAPAPGASVLVRPRRDDQPPVRAIVSRRTRVRLQLALETDPPPWLLEGRVIVELLPDEVTHARAVEALRQLRAADRGPLLHTRRVLLAEERPRFDRPEELAAELNPEQREAVALALAAEDLFLVHGPPGTGKSTVLAEIAVRAVERGEKLLVCAPSNAAVDHLVELLAGRGLAVLRVGHPARVSEPLLRHTLDVRVEEHEDRRIARELTDEAHALLGHARRQRTRGRSRERFATARESQAEARRLLAEARELEKRAVKAVLDRASAICVTCAGVATPLLRDVTFDRALLDEATQAVEPIALWPFLRAPRVVLAGDHRQLPPTVISPEAARKGLSTSLFERLLEDHGAGVGRMLREQHRMHRTIMEFASARSYGGELRAHPAVAEHVLGLAIDAPPLLFLDTAGKGFDEELEPGTESRRNPGEAGLVADHVRALLAAGLAEQAIGVISPYAAQVGLLRERIPEGVEVDTVDAFQGREKEAILVSLVRSNEQGELGFLEDLRRLNVALTRARRHLFVTGDSATLSRLPYLDALVAYAQERGGYRSAWEWP